VHRGKKTFISRGECLKPKPKPNSNTQQSQQIALSQNYLEACIPNGCSGGQSDSLMDWLEVNGTVTTACFGNAQSCITHCVDKTPFTRFIAQPQTLNSVASIQAAIMQGGPVLTMIDASQLEFYQSGTEQQRTTCGC